MQVKSQVAHRHVLMTKDGWLCGALTCSKNQSPYLETCEKWLGAGFELERRRIKSGMWRA